MDAKITPANHALQGTYLHFALGHRIYTFTLDVHAKCISAIQRSERSEDTSCYQRDCLRRQPRA